MLRINLLPPYVQQVRRAKRLIPVFALAFALSVALPLAAYFYLHGKLTALTQEANDAVTGKGVTDSLNSAEASVFHRRRCLRPEMGRQVRAACSDNSQVQLYLRRRSDHRADHGDQSVFSQC